MGDTVAQYLTWGDHSMKKLAATSTILLFVFAGCGGSATSSAQGGAVSTSPAAKSSAAASAPATTTQAEAGKYSVTIDGSHQTKDYKGNPTLVVDYTFTNNDAKAVMFLIAIRSKAFQNGVELESAMVMDDKTYNAGLGQKEIKQGATTKAQGAYVLADKSEVTIEVGEMFSFSDKLIATKKISVK